MRLSIKMSNIDALCEELLKLPAGALFRHNDAGDLPAAGRRQKFFFTNRGQAKTGYSYRTRTSRGSCPRSCRLFDICYASVNPLRWYWQQLGRWYKRGAEYLDHRTVIKLAKAASHLTGWTYTHWDWKRYLRTFLRGNELGFTINASTESPEEALEAFRAGLPVTLVAPPFVRKKIMLEDVPAIPCPALLQKGFTCDMCGKGSPLCARADRHYIILFPAHGARARAVWNRIAKFWTDFLPEMEDACA